MAEGGGELEMDEFGNPLTIRSPPFAEDLGETIFRDHGDAQYNTGDNLVGEDSFSEPPIVPRGRPIEEIRKAWEAWERKEIKTTLNEKDLNKALNSSRWVFTPLGRNLVAKRIEVKGGNFYFFPNPRYFDVKNMTDDQLQNLQPDKSIRLTAEKLRGKLYKESSMKKLYGKYFVDYFRNLLLTKDEQPQTEQTETQPMDNEPSRSQPQQVSTETQTAISTFVEKLDTSPVKLTKNFTGFTDEDFRKVGFTEQHIREIKGVLQFIDNSLTIQTEKDMKIGELETKLSALNKKYIKSMEDNIDLTEKQIKEKQELLDKLNEESGKRQEMSKVVETQVQRLKNIIRNKLKDPTSKNH